MTPPSNSSHSGTGSTAPSPNLPSKVKEAIAGVVDTVKGAVDSVGKALSPGASTKPQEPAPSSGTSSNSGTSGGRKTSTGQSDAGQP